MSKRGADFIDKWMAEHLPNSFTDDPAAITDLADQAMKAADREGISSEEIAEEVGSVFKVIADAMQHRGGNAPESDQAVLDMLTTRLAREAGILETQAGDLIKRIGTDWDSLLNEAHFLKELEGRLSKK